LQRSHWALDGVLNPLLILVDDPARLLSPGTATQVNLAENNYCQKEMVRI